MNVNLDRLLDACSDGGQDSGITIRAVLEPLAGPGEPVKPAIYGGGRYQADRRWWGDGEGRRPVDAVVIDNVASQANRLEAALESLRARLGIPELVLDLEGIGGLPPHLPKRLSSFRFPHRQADAYLRDAALNGSAFRQTEIGGRLLAATADRAEPLLEWFPQALLFGFWQSHLGKKRTQAKLARSWTSEIVGYVPASTEPVPQLGYKGDPLNLTAEEPVSYSENDLLVGWELTAGAKKAGQRKSKDSLAEIGHGQVPAEGTAAVGFQAIEQRATVSFASLRRIRTGNADAGAGAPARALLAALGLVAHTAAFGQAFNLRSRCDLRPRPASTRWTWLGLEDEEELTPLDLPAAEALFRTCVDRAESAGLPVGRRWPPEPLVLKPGDQLASAIRAAWPLD